MRVLHFHTGFAAQMQGLVQGTVAVIVALEILVSGMRGVEPPTPGQHLAQRDQFAGGRVARGHVGQARAQAKRPLIELLAEQIAHGVELRAAGLCAGDAHGRDAQRAMPDQGRDVEGDALRLGAFAIALQVGPGKRQGVVTYASQQVLMQLHVGRVDRKRRETTVARDFGGHTLRHLALAAAVLQQAQVGMGVDVDKTGGDNLAAGVNASARRHPGPIADKHDVSARHANGST